MSERLLHFSHKGVPNPCVLAVVGLLRPAYSWGPLTLNFAPFLYTLPPNLAL